MVFFGRNAQISTPMKTAKNRQMRNDAEMLDAAEMSENMFES